MGPRSRDRGIEADPNVKGILPNMLQWGRDRAIAELPRILIAPGCTRQLQWGRDRAIAELEAEPRRPPHPGRLQWGRDRAIAEFRRRGRPVHRPLRASMGPRSRDRGIVTSSEGLAQTVMLQWGRDRAIAELRRGLPTRRDRVLQWGRDRAIAELKSASVLIAVVPASMGPRSRDRGIRAARPP